MALLNGLCAVSGFLAIATTAGRSWGREPVEKLALAMQQAR